MGFFWLEVAKKQETNVDGIFFFNFLLEVAKKKIGNER